MNKVVLITGAAKGLGFEAAKQLGKLGLTVVVATRTREKSDETAARLKTMGIDAYGVTLDVNKHDDINGLVKFIEEKFGKLDVLINNAGAYFNRRQRMSCGVEKTFLVNHLAPSCLPIFCLIICKAMPASSMFHPMPINTDNSI